MGAPDLVMFDEPSLGLAPAMVQEVLRTIRDLNAEGLTCMLVEQNVAVSLKLARRAYVLENGRITLSGRSADILGAEGVAEKYLGNGRAVGDRTSARQRAMSERLGQILRT
jgi:branched-chain amino acid transport system ATP-binding protein